MTTFSLSQKLLRRLAHKVEAEQGLLISLLAVLAVIFLGTCVLASWS